jgi:hypothetical protein
MRRGSDDDDEDEDGSRAAAPREMSGVGPPRVRPHRCWYDEAYVDDPTWWFFPHVIGRESPIVVERTEADRARRLARIRTPSQSVPSSSASPSPSASHDTSPGFSLPVINRTYGTAGVPSASSAAAAVSAQEIRVAARDKQAREAYDLLSKRPLASVLPVEMLRNPSEILIPSEWALLCRWLPVRFSSMTPMPVFRATRDGFNLGSLFLKVQAAGALVIIVQSAAVDIEVGPGVFGAFVPNVLRPSPGKYYGTGEAFLWRVHPEPEKFEWVPGQKSFFLHVERRSLSIGGGKGVGLWLDDELSYGWSEQCQTFRNEPLHVGSTQFDVLNIEVVSFRCA